MLLKENQSTACSDCSLVLKLLMDQGGALWHILLGVWHRTERNLLSG